MRECAIRTEEKDELDIVHLDGSLDAYSFPRLEGALNELRQAHRHRVILDCHTLEYISSVALGALIGFARRARENGGDLKLVRLSDKIYNIVELLGFHRILEIHKTAEEATKEFEKTSGE